jgi:hypothetical protein
MTVPRQITLAWEVSGKLGDNLAQEDSKTGSARELTWPSKRRGRDYPGPGRQGKVRQCSQEGALAARGRALTEAAAISGSGRACACGARSSTVTRKAFKPCAPCKSSNSTSSVPAFR